MVPKSTIVRIILTFTIGIITTKYLKYCLAIVTLLDCKSGAMRAIWVSLMGGKGGFDAGKTIKTAF
ncbi:hypothetical protein CHL74_14555 [Prevotella sp. 885]|nr:hypothetical protein CHL74_14555 [Prevotella sp. 885]